MAQEFAALPPSDRPFAAERTVWPDDDLAASRPEHVDTAQTYPEQREPEQREPEQRDPEQPDPEQPDPEQADPERLALSRPEDTADRADHELPPPIPPAALPRSGRWIALTAANAVLLIAAVAAVTLVVRHDQASSTARTAATSVAAAPTSSASASLAPNGQNQLIVDPAAATAPNEAAIAASLNRYFGAINNHDYLGYKRQFILVLRGKLSRAAFSAGFGTVNDSAEQLHNISVIGGGKVDAFVTFISQQPAADRRASPTCTAWSTEFYLGKRGTRYLLVAPPQWYQVSTSRCP
jgi:hypothetical protein